MVAAVSEWVKGLLADGRNPLSHPAFIDFCPGLGYNITIYFMASRA